MKKILPKNKVKDLVKEALKDHQVFAPVNNDNVISFRQIANPSDFTLEFSNTKVPPKAIFFKQTETLFKFTRDKIEPTNNAKNKIVILGIRPCDAKSLTILDHVFDGDYKDPHYLQKRENTVLIGLSCVQPGVNCFCSSLDGGPTDAKDVDILLTDIGKNYFVEIVTEKGKNFVDSIKGLFESTKKADEEKRTETDKKARGVVKRKMDTEGLTDKLDGIFESQFWKRTAMKCLGCGICTFLCPTCHCFDIHDESTVEKGARIRVWDSCMYPEYTLQSSGYNPRPERMNRVRNRIYHKYSYFPKNFDVIACVGCGRCIDMCPVNIDVIDITTRVKEVRE